MPEIIGDVIARWRQSLDGRPLPPDGAATVAAWMAELVTEVAAAGFSMKEFIEETEDYPNDWLKPEYDDLRRQQRGIE